LGKKRGLPRRELIFKICWLVKRLKIPTACFFENEFYGCLSAISSRTLLVVRWYSPWIHDPLVGDSVIHDATVSSSGSRLRNWLHVLSYSAPSGTKYRQSSQMRFLGFMAGVYMKKRILSRALLKKLWLQLPAPLCILFLLVRLILKNRRAYELSYRHGHPNCNLYFL
jgi:hypothetical protein